MKIVAPPHPGKTLLEDFMIPLGLSAHRLATELRIPATRIGDIIHGRRGVTADTALRLARYFGTSAAFWMNLQMLYDLRTTANERAPEIERDIRPRAMMHA
ncbi:MAG: HigA family addiction module antitoxin [Candidatus Baltobacteraceae bacterium]